MPKTSSKTRRKSPFSPKNPGIFGVGGRPEARNFGRKSGSRAVRRQTAIRWSAGLESHQESARGRDHRDLETGPGVRLGAAGRLREVAERAVHVEGPVADAKQDRRAIGMGSSYAWCSTPDPPRRPQRRRGASPPLLDGVPAAKSFADRRAACRRPISGLLRAIVYGAIRLCRNVRACRTAPVIFVRSWTGRMRACNRPTPSGSKSGPVQSPDGPGASTRRRSGTPWIRGDAVPSAAGSDDDRVGVPLVFDRPRCGVPGRSGRRAWPRASRGPSRVRTSGNHW